MQTYKIVVFVPEAGAERVRAAIDIYPLAAVE